MKRTALSRGAAFDKRGRRRFSTFDPVDGERRRTPMKRKPPRRLERRAHLEEHGDFVRAQPCIFCGRPPHLRLVEHKGAWRTGIEAAHITLSRNEKGMGLKVRDEQRVPLCTGEDGCHKQWDQHRGAFKGWTDEQRYDLGTSWVHATLARWEAHRLTQAAKELEAEAA